MVGFFRSGNLASRVFDRQFLSPRPSATVNTVRQFYENLVPSYTIYDIDCPDYSFRKFTDDGKYLVAFSRNHQDLIVYRPIWLTFSCHEECDSHDLPANAERFDSFFKQLYSISLASSNEYICKDFFLYMECHQYGLFATSTAQSNDSSATDGAIHGVPSIEKITFYLVRLEDGAILDEKAFCNDFINLAHSIGAYLYEDLVCIVSLRYQTIHVLQIRDSGSLVEVRRIGAFCREDDELFLYSHGQAAQGNSFLPGIKQRLLSFIFRKTWNDEPDQALRVQHLKKKFYFHFQDYVDLIIWKVQFLDRRHLFIKFGSVDGGVTRSTDQNLAFFAVYNMETTDIVSLYQNSSEELYSLFEHYYDHFHANPQNSSHEKFISSHSNSVHALDQLRTIKNKASSSSQFVKKMMASLPYTCQSQSPSPYFDLSIFRYDEKLISAIDRHRHCTEHPIKFISVRQPNVVKFKIKPGSDSGGSDSRAKRISSFLFHPFFPLALSIQQTYMQPTVVNVHFRR
ncbi:light-mediated development protein DET1-like isoform X1 [Triticum dicoccoides]|uniref:light-mediated development protein DET1-like isoform X1 n=1 Tax=Triticum dicoccoides TaxID=85692 RepID=UPI00188E2206|nr:light-mediated development protein DET1-like isoform X1 [Triticum dicoccoides]